MLGGEEEGEGRRGKGARGTVRREAREGKGGKKKGGQLLGDLGVAGRRGGRKEEEGKKMGSGKKDVREREQVKGKGRGRKEREIWEYREKEGKADGFPRTKIMIEENDNNDKRKGKWEVYARGRRMKGRK